MTTQPAAMDDVVEVWRLRVSAAPLAEWGRYLSEAERERAARFVHERDRDRFVAVRGCLRHLLGRCLDRAPGTIVLEAGARGKPALGGADRAAELRFNVSHSGDVGLVALSRRREVGVDVEQISADLDVEDLGRTSFSLEEMDGLRACPAAARVERFFQLWTAKEAYVKALGDGFSIPLQAFTVRCQAGAAEWAVASDSPSAVSVIRPLSAPAGYAAAVAAAGTGWRVVEREAIL